MQSTMLIHLDIRFKNAHKSLGRDHNSQCVTVHVGGGGGGGHPPAEATDWLTDGPSAPNEHYYCFCYGDLDGFPPLLPLKSLYLSLKLILF